MPKTRKSPSGQADGNTKVFSSQDAYWHHLQKQQDTKVLAKRVVSLLAEIYGPDSKRVQRMADCGAFMDWALTGDKKFRKLISAHYCENRMCPICMVRRARRESIAFEQLMCAAEEGCELNADGLQVEDLFHPVDLNASSNAVFRDPDFPAVFFLFVTLTASSPEMDKISDFIGAMSAAYRKLTRRRFWQRNVLGVIKKLGVTFNEETHRPHPHLHLILAVPTRYFTGHRWGLTQKAIYSVWGREMGKAGYACSPRYGVDLRFSECDVTFKKAYNKAVHNSKKYGDPLIYAFSQRAKAKMKIEASRGEDSVDLFSDGEAVIDRHSILRNLPRELAQYMVQLFKFSNESITAEVFRALDEGLKDVHFLSFQGIFKTYRSLQKAHRLILRPIEDGDLLCFRYWQNFIYSPWGYFVDLVDLGRELPVSEFKQAVLVEKRGRLKRKRVQASFPRPFIGPLWPREQKSSSVSLEDPEPFYPAGFVGPILSKYTSFKYDMFSICRLDQSILGDLLAKKGIFKITHPQRVRILRWCMQNRKDPWELQHQVFMDCGVYLDFSRENIFRFQLEKIRKVFGDSFATWGYVYFPERLFYPDTEICGPKPGSEEDFVLRWRRFNPYLQADKTLREREEKLLDSVPLPNGARPNSADLPVDNTPCEDLSYW